MGAVVDARRLTRKALTPAARQHRQGQLLRHPEEAAGYLTALSAGPLEV
jgi:hypothetical protein